MELTASQLGILAELFLDLSKGSFLTSFAIPALTNIQDGVIFIKLMGLGVVCIYASLYFARLKGEL